MTDQAREEAAGEWQAIETAPRDGSVIIGRGYNWGRAGNARHLAEVVWSAERQEWRGADEPDQSFVYLTEWLTSTARPTPPAEIAAGTEVARLREALERQMQEDQDEHLPSSLARKRGLVWLEGWFDLRLALSPAIAADAPPRDHRAAREGREVMGQRITAIQVSFGAPVVMSRDQERRLYDLISQVCDGYEVEHPDRVMWLAGFGGLPMNIHDDNALDFDMSVLAMDCAERERFDTDTPIARAQTGEAA